MISKFARCWSVAALRRGYQSRGVAILRPSTNVTTSSVAVNSTERGRRSPTSISKVLIPGRHKMVTLRSEMSNNIAKLVRRKARIDHDGQVMQPEFCLPVPGTNVHVGGLVAFVGVKERTVGTPAKDCRHTLPRELIYDMRLQGLTSFAFAVAELRDHVAARNRGEGDRFHDAVRDQVGAQFGIVVFHLMIGGR